MERLIILIFVSMVIGVICIVPTLIMIQKKYKNLFGFALLNALIAPTLIGFVGMFFYALLFKGERGSASLEDGLNDLHQKFVGRLKKKKESAQEDFLQSERDDDADDDDRDLEDEDDPHQDDDQDEDEQDDEDASEDDDHETQKGEKFDPNAWKKSYNKSIYDVMRKSIVKKKKG